MKIPDSARELLTSDALAHLATIDGGGRPHVTCAWVGVEADEIVIATLFDQRKLANMRRDPRVTMSLEGHRTNDMGLREYLVIAGRAQVTEGGAPELLQDLARTYLGPDVSFPPMPDPPPGYVTRITPERLSGVGPWASA
ncbi:PPOX class F420-dependent oxidoreductase [soil metagenome]